MILVFNVSTMEKRIVLEGGFAAIDLFEYTDCGNDPGGNNAKYVYRIKFVQTPEIELMEDGVLVLRVGGTWENNDFLRGMTELYQMLKKHD